MKQEKQMPVGFRLVRIKTEQFAILSDAYDQKNEQVGMTLGLKFGTDPDKRIVAVFLLVQFEQEKKPFLIMEISNHYEIEPKAWENFIKTKDKLVVPKNLATHLTMLTVGTLRGALHCKTENTEFNRFILPTVNVTKMVKEDILLN